MPYQFGPALTPLDALNNYFSNLFPLLFDGLLRVFSAVIVFLVGWLVALMVKIAIEYVLEKIKIEEIFKQARIAQYFKDFTWEERLDKILAEIVFWAVFVIFLMVAFDILGLQIVNTFIKEALYYLPRALSGGLILLAGFLFSDLIRKILIGFFHGLEKKNARMITGLVRWTIVVFAFLAALNQWGIAADIINILLTGFVLFLALAGGLAFGLGGQETAREILENLRRELR